MLLISICKINKRLWSIFLKRKIQNDFIIFYIFGDLKMKSSYVAIYPCYVIYNHFKVKIFSLSDSKNVKISFSNRFWYRLLHIVKRIILRLSQFLSVSFGIKSMDNQTNASPEKSLGLIYAYASIYLLPAVLYSVGCLHFELASLFQNLWMYTRYICKYKHILFAISIKRIISRFDAIYMLSNAWSNIYRYSFLNCITQLDVLLIDLNLFTRKEIHVHTTMLLTGEYQVYWKQIYP